MTTHRVASVRRFFQNHFPERQLYHRSNGQVKFVVLSAPAQIILLFLSLGFFGWVAYASVNVVFKDQIIAAKEKHFSTMQAAYETRIAEMQASLDEIHSALVTTQDRFNTAASDLEERHRQLAEIFKKHEAALHDLGAVKTRVAQYYRTIDTKDDGNRLVMTGDEAEPQLRASRAVADNIGGPSAPLEDRDSTAVLGAAVSKSLPVPLATQSRGIATRFGTLEAAQQSMISELDNAAGQATSGLEKIVSITGLSVDRVLEQVREDEGEGKVASRPGMEGQGGPYVPLDTLGNLARKLVHAPAPDPALDHLQSTVDRLAGLEAALSVIPLVVPLNTEFHVASGFGRRVDPFTGAPAFHYGLDFVAPYQTPILATSDGVVTLAQRQGPYGNLVEIDHGHGIRTRYGHLYRIDVKVGQTVKFHQQVGLLGSTGRSTGPHVHYEIRFNGTLRDPARFLEAGRYVFQG